jgi:hypothetical protein
MWVNATPATYQFVDMSAHPHDFLIKFMPSHTLLIAILAFFRPMHDRIKVLGCNEM